MANKAFATVDLSPFLSGENDENTKAKAKETIIKACSGCGFFLISNHGIPQELLNKAIQLSRTYFKYPDEEKFKTAGYKKQLDVIPDYKNEYILMFSPDTGFNLPTSPPEFKETLEQMFTYFIKLGEVVEGIINECLGLPENFLKEYNPDRSCDTIGAIHYFPAAVGAGEDDHLGVPEHQDSNCISFVVQDDVSGLQVQKDGDWITVVPEEGKIAVNLGDVIQVLTNKKFKSAKHRVLSPKGRDRNSFAFLYNLPGEKWVEPLPQFTNEIGEKPKYRGFLYRDYEAVRSRNKTHPPARREDALNINYYALSA